MALLPSVLSRKVVLDIPTYYTNSSGFYMLQPGYTNTTMMLSLANTSTTNIRTYSGFASAWSYIHDKDLDSNVYYGMSEGGSSPKNLLRYILTKGGTTISTTNIHLYSGATTSVLGACYAPRVLWRSTAGHGAFIIGGFNQSVIHVLEFASDKNSIVNSYTVPYTSEVYGTEVVPREASGFTNDYGVAYTRGSKQMTSWTIDMSTRNWTNRFDNLYSSTPAGSINGSSMIYYPPGKPIFTGDPDTSANRLAFTDTSTQSLYVFTVTESSNILVWNYLKTVTFTGASGGLYPYSMSTTSYNSIS